MQQEVKIEAADPVVQTELEKSLKAVEAAAADWGVHSDHVEGRFVAALLMAIRTVGRSNIATLNDLKGLLQTAHESGNLELIKLRALIEGADKVLAMAKKGAENALAAQVNIREQTKQTISALAQQMATQLLDQTHGWLLIQQKARYRLGAWILAGVVSMSALAILMAGYEARAWQDAPATEALARCAATSFPVQIGSRAKLDRGCAVEELTPRSLTSIPESIRNWWFKGAPANTASASN